MAKKRKNPLTNRFPMGLVDLFDKLGFQQEIILEWCMETLGPNAYGKVSEYPWILLEKDAPGAGFKRVSRVADRCGVALNKTERRAWFCWSHCTMTGDTWTLVDNVIEAAGEVFSDTSPSVMKPAFKYAFDEDILARRVENGLMYLAAKKRADQEESVAESMGLLLCRISNRSGYPTDTLALFSTLSKKPNELD